MTNKTYPQTPPKKNLTDRGASRRQFITAAGRTTAGILSFRALAGARQESTGTTKGKAVADSPQHALKAEILHPQSMDAAKSMAIVKGGTPGSRFFNYQPYITVTDRGTWICCWTQGSIEAAPDQRVVCTRSMNQGLMWSEEISIENAAPGYRVPAWVTCFTVPNTGRIYAFYWYNQNGEPLRDAGDMFFKFSDDDGCTWSDRFAIGIPRTALDDPHAEIHGWNFGPPTLLETGQVILTYVKIRRSTLFPRGWRLEQNGQWTNLNAADPSRKPTVDGGNPNDWETEVFLLECRNILSESDPQALRFCSLPEGDNGLWVNYPGTNHHFGQEGSVVSLAGGRLLCVFRTRQGHPYYSVSADRGRSWSSPEVLRYCPGGEAINQPCAPCPITRCSDGRLVLLFHNAKPESEGWHPRNPLWVAIARESATTSDNAGLFFTKPKVIIYNDRVPGGPFKDAEISYPRFYEIAGKYYVVYANKTSEIRINRVAPELVDDFGLPR